MKSIPKKIVYIIFCIVAMTFFSVNANAENNMCGPNATWKVENGTLTISGSGSMYNYEGSGNTTDGFTSNSPFSDQRDKVTKIIIDNGISYVGNSAFKGFTKVESVSIADTVEGIGDYAFYHLEKLSDLTLPNSVKSIGRDAFAGGLELKRLILSNSLKNIGVNAFFNSVNLVEVTIPNGVELIGDYMFDSSMWNGNVTITIPDSVTRIGEAAFNRCAAICKVDMPNSVSEIGKRAFCGCINLTKIRIPTELREIPDYAFMGSGLEEITIPKNIQKIGSQVVSPVGEMGLNYSAIKSVTFEGNSVSISEDAFEGVGEKTPATLVVPGDWKGTLPASEKEKWYGGYFKVVKEEEIQKIINVTGISLNKDNITMSVGTTENLVATVVPSDATDKTITWKSDNEAVAVVMDGIVTAKAEGKATITVTTTDQSKSATCKVVVKKKEQPTTEVTPTPDVVQEPVTIAKAPTSVKVKAKKNKVTVSWKKIKKTEKTKKLIRQIKSIQVQYCTDPKFEQNPVIKMVGKSKTKVVLKLKRKTTYYIRVRYVGKDGFSNWSKVKRVKTK